MSVRSSFFAFCTALLAKFRSMRRVEMFSPVVFLLEFWMSAMECWQVPANGHTTGSLTLIQQKALKRLSMPRRCLLATPLSGYPRPCQPYWVQRVCKRTVINCTEKLVMGLCITLLCRATRYHVRLDAATTRATRLLFCTTGILLRRLAFEPALASVSHVIVDEVSLTQNLAAPDTNLWGGVYLACCCVGLGGRANIQHCRTLGCAFMPRAGGSPGLPAC